MTRRRTWDQRAFALFFRLNGEMLDNDPFSRRAWRASRIIVRLVEAMEQRA